MGLRLGTAGLLFTGLLMAQTGGSSRTVPAPPSSTKPNQPVYDRLYNRLINRVPANAPPVTQRQRFITYVVHTVGPMELVRVAAIAGIDQGLHRPEEWQLGASGYFTRFGNKMGHHAVHTTLTYATSALLHEDNRYFMCDCQGFRPRLRHALISTFTARRDGRVVFSISSATGVVGAAAISRAWAPPSWQHARNVEESIGFGFLGIAAMNAVREFLPRR
jgi:hypothetical protein